MPSCRAVIPKKLPAPILVDRLKETAAMLASFAPEQARWLRANCGGLYPCIECEYLAPGVKAMSAPASARNCLRVDRPTLARWLENGGAVNA
jgi:hypothetical protein